MNRQAEKHLARAEGFLARGDEFYGKAADAIIAAQQADPTLSNREIGERFDRSREWVSKLVTWRTSGTTSPTPYSQTGRPHQDTVATKKALRELPAAKIKAILDDLPDEAIEKVAEATEGTKVTRRLYPDKPKPPFKEAKRKAKAKDTKILKQNPLEARARLGSTMGSARAAIRVLVIGYQDFLAVVDDEEIRDDARESLITLQADINLALGEVLEGSIEEAFSRLLDEEGVK